MDTVWIDAMQVCLVITAVSVVATFFGWWHDADFNGFTAFTSFVGAVAFCFAIFFLGIDLATA